VQSPEVVKALLERVQYDSNLTVRLAAIEALRSQVDRPEVGTTLAAALERQDAPLLQIALTDALLASGSATGEAAVRAVLDRDELDPTVREYVQNALEEVAADPGSEI
jgi:L-fucose mutarotase/ribose pyranase (RbsD/FucU family)